MGEVEFERVIDAVRKEVALAPAVHVVTGVRGFDWRAKAPGKPGSRRDAPLARIRRVGEGRKRFR